MESIDNFSANKLVDIVFEWLQDFEDERGFVYVERIHNMVLDSPFIIIDGVDLRKSATGIMLIDGLCKDVARFRKVVSAFEWAIKKLSREFNGVSDIHVRFHNIEETRVSLHAVGARFYEKGVTIRGRVVSMSPKTPYATRYTYRCTDPDCKTKGFVMTSAVLTEGEVLKRPDRCPECKSKFIEMMGSDIHDSQIVKIIEAQSSQTPSNLQIWCVGADLCNKVEPGRVVDVFGIVDIDNNKPLGRPAYRINANNIEHYGDEYEGFEITDVDIQRFSKSNPDSIVNQPGFWEKATLSFAPEVLGMKEVKEALLMLCVSLNLRKKHQSAISEALRDSTTMNILIAGSPGIAKSRCLKFTSRVAPNSGFVSAATAREASLTVFAENDKESGYFMITPGFLPRCNNGIACMDEFDKADKVVYTKLHEIGSDKTCSYAKGGHSGTLPADCAIVCACNSVFPYWNERMDIQKNLSFMPPSMLTRFDLIFVIMDRIDEQGDEAVAQKVFDNNDSLWWQKYMDDKETIFGFRTMRKYITFVNTQVPFPTLPKELEQYVVKRYSKKRRDEALIGLITPRYVNNMTRLAIAHARFMQKKEVDMYDLDAAESLLEWSMKTAAFDPVSGKFDANITNGMMPKSESDQQRDDASEFVRILAQVRRQIGGTFVPEMELHKILKEKGWDTIRIKIAKSNYEQEHPDSRKAAFYWTTESDVNGWRMNIDGAK